MDGGSRCRPVFKTSPHSAKTWLLKRFLEACCDGGGVCWSQTLALVARMDHGPCRSDQIRIHAPNVSAPEAQDK